jgi:ZIP family zinc transporter
MVGMSYVLLQQGSTIAPVAGIAGSVIGIVFIYSCHRLSLLSLVDLSQPSDPGSASVRQVIHRGAFHSAAEGIAIGVGFLVDARLGLFLAGTIALHNVAEGTAIIAALRARGWSMSGATLLAVATKSTHVPLAVATAAWLPSSALPYGLGFAAGSMFYLVLVELLPESYLQRGHTGIAIAASAAISIVVLVDALLTGS